MAQPLVPASSRGPGLFHLGHPRLLARPIHRAVDAGVWLVARAGVTWHFHRLFHQCDVLYSHRHTRRSCRAAPRGSGRRVADDGRVRTAQHGHGRDGELGDVVDRARVRDARCAGDGLDQRSRQPLPCVAGIGVCAYPLRRLGQRRGLPPPGNLVDRRLRLADGVRGHGRNLGGAGVPGNFLGLSLRSMRRPQVRWSC